VIADEPTPGLDEKSVHETLDYFRQMAEDNVGILLITHDINVALKIADKIAIFYAGYVIEVANSKDFTGNGEKLLHPYTKALYQALPDTDFKLTFGHQPLQGEIRKGCVYYERCDFHDEKCLNESPKLTNLEDKKVRCHKAKELYSLTNDKSYSKVTNNLMEGLRLVN
jgi:peptide/nickel transport system ATP-binding protein